MSKLVAAQSTSEIESLLQEMVEDTYVHATRYSVASAALLLGLRTLAEKPDLLTGHLPTDRARARVRVRRG